MDRLEKQILCISTVCLIFIFLFALYWLPTLPHKESDNEKTGVEAATEMAGTSPQVPTQSMCSEETDATAPEQETWKISVLNTANGKQKFQFTLEDYIEKYNFLYRLEHDRTWLLPKEEWHRFDSQESPFSDIDTARYEFDPDKNVHSDPDLWAFIDPEDGNLCEVSLGMPEHDWTQWRYEVFQQQCYYTLSVFYPELTAEEVWALFDLLYADAAENEYLSQSDKPDPVTIRFRGDVGCYGFIHSGVIRINVIPVTAELLENFTDGGGSTYGI